MAAARAKLGLPKIEKTSDLVLPRRRLRRPSRLGKTRQTRPPRSARSSEMSPSQSRREPPEGVFFVRFGFAVMKKQPIASAAGCY
jgi:hypothetical protein